MKRTRLYYARVAAGILKRISYATPATVTEANEPWNSPVAVVYDSTWSEGSGGQGVFMQAAAQEITDVDEIWHARQLKHDGAKPGNLQSFTGRSIRRVYKATPECVWLNAVQRRGERFVRDYRVEISLTVLRRQFAEIRRAGTSQPRPKRKR